MDSPILGADGLSLVQRETMAKILQMETAGKPVSILTLSHFMGISKAKANHRLRTLAMKGRLAVSTKTVSKAGGGQTYRIIQPPKPRPKPETIVREDGVRFTKCPPAYAHGYLSWGSSLGRNRHHSAD